MVKKINLYKSFNIKKIANDNVININKIKKNLNLTLRPYMV